MPDEKTVVVSTSEKDKPETREVTVGPIQVAVTVTVRSSDPAGPPDDGGKAGLGPRR